MGGARRKATERELRKRDDGISALRVHLRPSGRFSFFLVSSFASHSDLPSCARVEIAQPKCAMCSPESVHVCVNRVAGNR